MADEKKNSKQPKITRVKAKDSAKPATKKSATKAVVQTAPTTKRARSRNPLRFIGRAFLGLIGYFKGAWFELRQVRWPNRRATWSMTGALLGFTAFFIVLILFADVAFENLFKLILK